MFEEMIINPHYSRDGRRVSSTGRRVLCVAAAGLLVALQASAQYPGQITKKDKDTPALRAVGVLEWTGEAGKPKMSRLVPVTVFDGEQLQDGGIYLARPQPLAVEGGVEYILQKDGVKIGVFDVQNAAQEQGSWVGLGRWKAIPNAAPKPSAAPAKIDDEESDRPTLHRKTHSGDASAGSDTNTPAAAADPDRPTLHNANPNSDESTGTTSGDPDRPTLKKGKPQEQTGYVESVPSATDPNRPKLARGKSAAGNAGPEELPTLTGLPEEMKQTVAVSDPRNKPEHPWGYSWAEPADELKMKAALENVARAALGLNSQTTPAGKAKTTAGSARTKHVDSTVESAPLLGEVFRVFELAYGGGATLVLTAHTDAPPEKQRLVTLIAQPDLYGSVLVLFKSVTDGAHLDDTPRMRLIDAVDATADNRGELLFELRGTSQRQFALYRVTRGAAEKLFVTGGDAIESQAKN